MGRKNWFRRTEALIPDTNKKIHNAVQNTICRGEFDFLLVSLIQSEFFSTGMSFVMTSTYLLNVIVIYARYVLNHRFDCIVDHASWWLSFWNQSRGFQDNGTKVVWAIRRIVYHMHSRFRTLLPFPSPLLLSHIWSHSLPRVIVDMCDTFMYVTADIST